MKHAWNDEVEHYEEEHNHGINKSDFATVFGAAFKTEFIEETVCAAFCASLPSTPFLCTLVSIPLANHFI